MSYRLLAGEFVIRYPDQPRGGPEPDGDTVRFAPDTIALVEELPRVSGRAPRINARGNVAVRLEAIDALETHFSGTHQELAGANAGRDLEAVAVRVSDREHRRHSRPAQELADVGAAGGPPRVGVVRRDTVALLDPDTGVG